MATVSVSQATIAGLITSGLSANTTYELTEDITINSSNVNTRPVPVACQFYIAVDGIIFDGKGYSITIDNVTGFKGLFKTDNGKGMTVQNLGVHASGTTTLFHMAGWIFATGQSDSDAVRTAINCYSTGKIGNAGGGGIFGMYGLSRAIRCYSTGEIAGGGASGIIGSYSGGPTKSSLAENCYSTGAITGGGASGICSQLAMFNNTGIDISNCYSTGDIIGEESAGICQCFDGDFGGASQSFFDTHKNFSIKNCYAAGRVLGINAAPITLNSVPGSVYYNALFVSNNIVTNTGASNGWSDSAANTYLSGTPGGAGTQVWYSMGTNMPYALSSSKRAITIPSIPIKKVGDAAFSISATKTAGSDSFTYSSSDSSVATVNSSGLVSIVGAGSTTLTVSLSATGGYDAASASTVLAVIAGDKSPVEAITAGLLPVGSEGTAAFTPNGVSAPVDFNVKSVAPTSSYREGNNKVATYVPTDSSKAAVSVKDLPATVDKVTIATSAPVNNKISLFVDAYEGGVNKHDFTNPLTLSFSIPGATPGSTYTFVKYNSDGSTKATYSNLVVDANGFVSFTTNSLCNYMGSKDIVSGLEITLSSSGVAHTDGVKYSIIDATTCAVTGSNTVTGQITIADRVRFGSDAPRTVTLIGASAFMGKSNIIQVICPNSVTRIENDAFKGCFNLNQITVPGLTYLGARAFSECSSLFEFTFYNVSDFTIALYTNNQANSQFYHCASLRNIYILEDVSASTVATKLRMSEWDVNWTSGGSLEYGQTMTIHKLPGGVHNTDWTLDPNNISAPPIFNNVIQDYTGPATRTISFDILLYFPELYIQYPMPEYIPVTITPPLMEGERLIITSSDKSIVTVQYGEISDGSPAIFNTPTGTPGISNITVSSVGSMKYNSTSLVKSYVTLPTSVTSSVQALTGGYLEVGSENVATIQPSGYTSPVTFNVKTLAPSTSQSDSTKKETSYTPDAGKVAVVVKDLPSQVTKVTIATSAPVDGMISLYVDAFNGTTPVTDFTGAPITLQFTIPGASAGDKYNFIKTKHDGSTVVFNNITLGAGGVATITSESLSGWEGSPASSGGGGGGVPCFPAGTKILTAGGYKAVEKLAAKDRIVTADGRAVPFKLYATHIANATKETAPYAIKAGAFGRAGPSADIKLSPLHAIQAAKGVWQIPKYAAAMNAGVQQYGVGEAVDYYHVELPNFFTDNIVAEGGAVVESYGAKQCAGMKNVYKYNATLGGFTRASAGSSKKASK